MNFISFGKLGLTISADITCGCGNKTFTVIDDETVKCLKCKQKYSVEVCYEKVISVSVSSPDVSGTG